VRPGANIPPVPENHFGDEVAARYDETLGRRGDPDVVEPAVAYLAGRAR
jgi:hypothetical protein